MVDEEAVRLENIGPAVSVAVEEFRDLRQVITGLDGIDAAGARQARDIALRFFERFLRALEIGAALGVQSIAARCFWSFTSAS